MQGPCLTIAPFLLLPAGSHSARCGSRPRQGRRSGHGHIEPR